MKKMKKFFALLIAMAMVISMMSISAFAAGEYTITVTNTEESISIDGKTYSAYKVFDMTYKGDAYSYSIDSDGDGAWAWSTLINGVTPDEDGVYTSTKYGITLTPSAADATVYVVTHTMTDAQARTLADDLEAAIENATPAGTATASGETATIAMDEAGYYAVYGTAKSSDPKDDDKEVVAAVALTNTDPAATVNPKASIPTVDKKITEVTEGGIDESILDEEGKAAVAKVGSTVSYEIDSTVPDLRGYDDYTWILTDTVSAGLTYVQNSFELKIKDAVVSTITPVFNGSTFTLTIPYDTLSKYAAGDAIVLTYNCTVNNNALTYNYESNTASLEYSNNPYDDTTNHTPDKKTYVIDLNLDVLKVNGQDETLAEATFKLYKEASATDQETGDTTTSKLYYKWDATNNVVTWVDSQEDGDDFTTDATGKFTQKVRGLDAGTYYFEETVAPEGYNLLSDPVAVVISVSESNDTVTYTATCGDKEATMTNGTINLTEAQNQNQPVATGSILNESGTELPSTGGIGTTIFYVVGAILVIGAGVVLVTRRRMDVQ